MQAAPANGEPSPTVALSAVPPPGVETMSVRGTR